MLATMTIVCISYSVATYVSLRRNKQKLHQNTQILYRKLLIILALDIVLGKCFADLETIILK
jgi:hypothetical protein